MAGRKMLSASLSVLVSCLCFSSLVSGVRLSAPPVPAWPAQFTVQLTIYVEKYGNNWSSKGVLYYDYSQKTFRADYIDWCLPLFDSGPTDQNNYTCSFLATQGNMYFVNHTANSWSEDQCCLFGKGLAAVPPDWMKNCQYNGTQKINDVECDAWWFPGTSDPEKPCYGYWSAQDEEHTPVQFFGLASVGPTILQYSGFSPGETPRNIPLGLPNPSCAKECVPPLTETLRTTLGRVGGTYAPPMPWPEC